MCDKNILFLYFYPTVSLIPGDWWDLRWEGNVWLFLLGLKGKKLADRWFWGFTLLPLCWKRETRRRVSISIIISPSHRPPTSKSYISSDCKVKWCICIVPIPTKSQIPFSFIYLLLRIDEKKKKISFQSIKKGHMRCVQFDPTSLPTNHKTSH